MNIPKPTTDLVRKLLEQQCPDVSLDHVRFAGSGWDNSMYRVGESLVARIPHRSESISTVHTEHQVLPILARMVAPSSSKIAVPQLVHAGQPTPSFDYPWSLLAWLPGTSLLGTEPGTAPSGLVEPLALFLAAVHEAAPSDAPRNPHRGGPLDQRHRVTQQYLDTASSKDAWVNDHSDKIQTEWCKLATAPEWGKPTVWLHGDLHPGNIITQNGTISAVIDWGDCCSGDPATDLSVAWMLFDRPQRQAFRDALNRLGHPADNETWLRAQGWAISLGLAHIAGTDDPKHMAFGKAVLQETLR